MRSHTAILRKDHRKSSTLDQEYLIEHHNTLFQQVKLVSYMLILFYPCFFIVDFFLLTSLNSFIFRFILAAVHLTGLVISFAFIMIDRIYRNRNIPKSFLTHCYVFLYLMMGAVTSINSQLVTGNIYTYIIILLGVGAIFPIAPRNLFFLFLGVHLFFITGLFLNEHDYFLLLSKLITATGTVVISFTISLSFYRYRQNDFYNKLKLKKNEESFRRLFNLNPNPLILIKRDQDEIVLMNSLAIEYYHLQNKDVSQLDLQFIFKDYQEKQTILNVLNEQQGIKNYVTEQTITPEIRNWSMLSFELVDYLDDTCILIGVTDITDLKIKEEELHKHASIDMLTGVMNRRRGLEMLHKQIDGGFSSQEFILCYIDINNLKMVNDLFGHSTGDELIKLCCETIIHHLGPDDILFRLGGDEFIIMFYNKYLHDAMLIWNNIEREFQNINQTKQRPFPISASHGFYHYQPGTIITVQEMLEMADQEMYKEKFIHKSLNNSQLIQHP